MDKYVTSMAHGTGSAVGSLRGAAAGGCRSRRDGRKGLTEKGLRSQDLTCPKALGLRWRGWRQGNGSGGFCSGHGGGEVGSRRIADGVHGAKAAVTTTSIKGLMSFQPLQVTGWHLNLTYLPIQPLE